MHNNAEFLSRLSSNAYEFDKRDMPFHLRKLSVGTFAKKIIKLDGTFITYLRTLVPANVCCFLRERQTLGSQNNAHVKISCKSLWSNVNPPRRA